MTNRPYLTGPERDRLRAAVDARVRARLRREDGCCRGCGASYDTHTIGCDSCSHRASQRRRHADPAKLEIDRERWRVYGARKRAKKRAAREQQRAA